MRARALALSLLGFAVIYACGTDNGNQSFGPIYTLDGGGTHADGSGGGGNPDGSSPTDAGGETDGGGETEGGTTSEGGGMDASACTNDVAVVAGGTTSAFGAIYTKGAWKASSLGASIMGDAGADSPAGQSLPAVVSLGAQFLSVMRTTNDALVYSTWTAGTWSQAAAVPSAAARDTPSLATLGGKAHLVYQGTDYKFVHARFSAAAWDLTNDPVGGAGASQAFGPTTPSCAGVGTDLVCAFAGDSSGGSFMFDIGYTPASDGGSGSWGAPAAHPAPIAYFRANPAIVSIPTGMLDALAVYVDDGTRRIQWTGRLQSNKTYTSPAVVDATALSDVGLSLALMANGKFALVFWGQDQYPYFSIGTQTGTSVAWTKPAALVALSNPKLPSPPVVAAGVCGDDAVAAYAQGGSAFVTRLRGSTWSAPETVTGVTGAANVGIATH
jgi:hypothetical protein